MDFYKKIQGTFAQWPNVKTIFGTTAICTKLTYPNEKN